jgi:septum site-determining protein MinD
MACGGARVGVVDTDIQSPGIHILFGLDEARIPYALNDYLYGDCTIKQAAHDVTDRLGANVAGTLYLIPSSIKAGEITRVLREGYDAERLSDGFRDASAELNLDVLVIDTHPGLNEETLLSLALSDALVLILRPDQQDYQGTSVTVEVARKLDVPHMSLILNKVPSLFDPDEVKTRVENAYQCDVSAVLPHSDEMMTLASADLFSIRYPDHPITAALRAVGDQLVR